MEMTKEQRINMEIAAEFVAKMIRKYGKEVLEEIEAEKIKKDKKDD